MASGGRILHHLHNHIGDSRATIVFVGYQSVGTFGYILTHNPHTVRLYGDSLPVRAKIAELKGFSAHADRHDLQRWLGTCTTKPHLYAVHGEAPSAAALVTMGDTAFGWKAIAERGTTVAF